MIKNIFLIIFQIFVISAFSQEGYRTVTFYNNKKALADVKIYSDDKLITISDKYGVTIISDSLENIHCSYLSVIDSIIFLKNAKNSRIDFNANILAEAEVKAKYNAKNHLARLLENCQKNCSKNDTVLYYDLCRQTVIPKLDKEEIIEAVIRSEYYVKDSSTKFTRISLFKPFDRRIYKLFDGSRKNRTAVINIDNYYNSILANKKNIQDSLYDASKISQGFNCGVLYNFYYYFFMISYSDTKISKHYQNRDTIIFKMEFKVNDNHSHNAYFTFVNNDIYKYEENKVSCGKTNSGERYFSYQYRSNCYFRSNTNHLYLSRMRYDIEKNNTTKSKTSYKYNQTQIVELCEKPLLNEGLNYVCSSLGAYEILKIKDKYPDIIIPCYPKLTRHSW